MWVLFRLTSHIRRPDLLLVDNSVGSSGNVVCDGVKANNHTVRIVRRKKQTCPYPRCLSIMVALRIMAVGLARLVPIISDAT